MKFLMSQNISSDLKGLNLNIKGTAGRLLNAVIRHNVLHYFHAAISNHLSDMSNICHVLYMFYLTEV